MNVIDLKNQVEQQFFKYTGLIATAIGFISFSHILYNIYITKKTVNFTYEALFLAIISNILLFYYGVSKKEIDIQIALMGILYLISHFFILYIKMKYRK